MKLSIEQAREIERLIKMKQKTNTQKDKSLVETPHQKQNYPFEQEDKQGNPTKVVHGPINTSSASSSCNFDLSKLIEYGLTFQDKEGIKKDISLYLKKPVCYIDDIKKAVKILKDEIMFLDPATAQPLLRKVNSIFGDKLNGN